jgi:hypothetical protein
MDKINIPLNLIDHCDELIKPGDASEYDDHGVIKLCWCCPKCGMATTTANGHTHIWNRETKSLKPSIIHAKELGGCGWHGFLTNGMFKGC